MATESEQIVVDLRKLVRGDVFGDVLHRAAFSTDASIYRIVPQCVVAPRDASDVAAVIRCARAKNVQVVARGAGSGVAGESLGGGIVFDMTRYMTRIVGMDGDGGTVTCEPGVVLADLNRYLARYGRKIGPDPSSANRATVGGCVANNATGAHSLQYGHIGEYVVNVEAVLDDGTIVQLSNDFDPAEARNPRLSAIAARCVELLSGKAAVIKKAMPRTKRNRSGYNVAGICRQGRIDLAKLMAGSEGTLAVFTKITLRTVALPRAKGLLQLEFDSLAKMAQAVPSIVDSGATACELMDRSLIDLAYKALPEYRDILPTGAAAVLLVEQIGDDEEEVRAKIGKTDSIVGETASGRRMFFDEKEQARLWKSRKDAGPLLYRGRSRKHPAEFMEDVSVEHTRLGEYIAGIQGIAGKYDFTVSFFGHAGDGELHLRPYLDLGDPADVQKMRAIADEVFALAWSLGGSISGEHADGLARAAFVKRQYGEEFYNVLCKIKEIFDPQGIFNPGKIINADPDVMVKNLRRAKHVLAGRTQTDLLFEKDELALELEQCYGCGLCLSRESDLRMCPVFRAMGEELGSSRAKANILNFWATGHISDADFESPEFRKFLDLCVNCKACQQQCPSGVDVSTLMAMARAEYVKRKGLRRTERALSNNRYLSLLSSAFAPISNFFMGLSVCRWALDKVAGLDRRRSMPAFGRGSFLRAGRRYLAACKPIERPIDRVAYFVDTYANYNDHEVGFAVLDVLRRNDIEVMLPRQLPAPLPAIVYGDVKRAKKDLAYNVRHLAKAVRDGYKIVCSEPSAALCLKEELRHYVGGEDAALVSQNTYELMSYLRDLYRRGRLKNPGVKDGQRDGTPQAGLGAKYNDGFVYHLPCHLCAVGGEGASIELLQGLCGVKVTDLAAGCCGLAGTFGMQKKNYELSSQIAAGLKDALDKSPTRQVLTECAACKMQIEHISGYNVLHPIRVLAEAYYSGTDES